MILHPQLVVKSIYRKYRGVLRNTILNSPLKHLQSAGKKTRINEFSGAKVVNEEAVLDRHTRICRVLLKELQSIVIQRKDVACEIGAGDCLASADLLLGFGFKKLYIVEKPVAPGYTGASRRPAPDFLTTGSAKSTGRDHRGRCPRSEHRPGQSGGGLL